MFSASIKSGKNSTGAGSTPDPQFNYVTALLNGDGTNGTQNNTFVDSSSNNYTITRVGNTTQGSFSPYGPNWSNYFNGSTDYLNITNNAAFDFGTSDVTIEAWVYLSSVGAQQIISAFPAGPAAGTGWAFGTTSSNYLLVDVFVGSTEQVVIANSNPISTNQWNHVAYTRSGGTNRLFVNGNLCTTSSNTLTQAINTGGNSIYIARSNFSGYTYPLTGYISNLRVVKGTAVYTGNFTPSTTSLIAISGTSLLTCQSNRFIDNSSNAFAITATGTPSVQRFNPFGTSTTYSTSVIGGSGYFDGTGDYLTVTPSTAVDLSGNYTIEAWINIKNATSAKAIISIGDYFGSSGLFLFTDSTGKLAIGYSNARQFTGTQTIVANTWNHVAFVRSSGIITTYLNGVSQGTLTTSNTFTGATNYIGQEWYNGALGGVTMNGYISNLRIVQNTAVYTSAFTPPTAPLIAITNTKLLLNTVNAGIYDSAMTNNYETLGSAQVSTSVVKYGTGSIKFNGATDWISSPLTINNSLNTGDFTLESWFYLTVNNDTYPIIVQAYDGTYGPIIRFGNNGFGNKLQVTMNAGSVSAIWSCATTMASVLNNWYHVALVRQSGVCKLYLNGVLQSIGSGINPSTYPNTSFTSTESVGANSLYVGYQFNGYLDDVRFTKGYARYTANFTPPTAAFPTTGPV